MHIRTYKGMCKRFLRVSLVEIFWILIFKKVVLRFPLRALDLFLNSYVAMYTSKLKNSSLGFQKEFQKKICAYFLLRAHMYVHTDI